MGSHVAWTPVFDKLPLLPCSTLGIFFFSFHAVSEAPLWPSIRTLCCGAAAQGFTNAG